MKWEHPPIIKIYEALGSIADGRIQITGTTAKVFSSSGNKFYTVKYDAVSHAVMVNDNGSFYKGYLGYPALAYLMLTGELVYQPSIAQKLKGIAWKDINQKFNNNFDKTLEFIMSKQSVEDRQKIVEGVDKIDAQLKIKSYNLLGEKVQPPEGY